MNFFTKALQWLLLLFVVTLFISSVATAQDPDYEKQLKEYEAKKKAIEEENKRKTEEAERTKQENALKQLP